MSAFICISTSPTGFPIDEYVLESYELNTKKWSQNGHAFAQDQLGWMYAHGEGVPENHVTAYAWFNIAAMNGFENAEQHKANIDSSPLDWFKTPEQKTKAQELAKEMIKRNPKLLK